jgi:Peroxiredoxin
MKMPEIGSPAPRFTLSDQEGKEHTLGGYAGKWVLLYFYPKDDTPGCTIEACAIRDQFKDFKDIGAIVLGVSTDSVASQKSSPTRMRSLSRSFPMRIRRWWADTACSGKRNLWGKPYMGTNRTSFLIDPSLAIAKVYEKVKPETHAAEVIADLKALGA